MGKLVEAVKEELTTKEAPTPKAKPKAPQAAVVQKGNFYRRRPSVDLKVTYPGVKMTGVVKKAVIRVKGVAYGQKVGFERRTCANPITVTKEQMTNMQAAVDNKISELTTELNLSVPEIGYINGHITNHFNDYITIK